MNAAFLLLHWGANVETTDLNGDTPLLWLIRNKSTVPGTTAHEIIKLLLRFGASTLASNPADGNNALHVLVTLPKIDLKTSFLLYQAAGPTGKLAMNKNNLTPYQVILRSCFQFVVVSIECRVVGLDSIFSSTHSVVKLYRCSISISFTSNTNFMFPTHTLTFFLHISLHS